MYDPLVSGEINHDAFPLLIVLFLGKYNPKISGNCRQTSGSGGSFLPLKAFPGDRRFTLSPSRPLRGGLPPAETQFPYTP